MNNDIYKCALNSNSNTRKVCIILMAMGEDIYTEMTINTIKSIRQCGVYTPILVMTDERHKCMDEFLFSNWIVTDHLYDHIKGGAGWKFCGDKYQIFDMAKNNGYDAFVWMDSDIIFRREWELMDIVKHLESGKTLNSVFMPGDNSDYMDGVVYFRDEEVPRFNSGFIATYVHNKPDEESFRELLKTYPDQDCYSILWRGNIIPYTGFGFRNTNVLHLGTQNVVDLIQPQPLYNFVGFFSNQEIDQFRYDMFNAKVILKERLEAFNSN